MKIKTLIVRPMLNPKRGLHLEKKKYVKVYSVHTFQTPLGEIFEISNIFYLNEG